MAKKRKKGKAPTIFDRTRLRAAQLRHVAERRYGDARALHDIKVNDRNNGTIYLAGLVVEILLKARLMTTYPWLETTPSSEMLSSQQDKDIWNLCYRLHDLDEIASRLPSVVTTIEARGGAPLDRAEAAEVMTTVKEIKVCLSH